MTPWIIVGVFMLGVGVVVFAQPRLGNHVFALEYHRKKAERFPRLSRISGWSWLMERPVRVRVGTRPWALIVLAIGLVITIDSFEA